MNFKLVSDFQPSGDQPEAIKQLTDGLGRGDKFQTLLGVTGSGKTFTIANVIAQLNRPVLVLSHNKTLAAQLYGEFKSFFPENAVEHFVSYYDYYQPEAYMPAQDMHIVRNPSAEPASPWYPIAFGDRLVTPEWTFDKDQLKRWP